MSKTHTELLEKYTNFTSGTEVQKVNIVRYKFDAMHSGSVKMEWNLHVSLPQSVLEGDKGIEKLTYFLQDSLWFIGPDDLLEAEGNLSNPQNNIVVFKRYEKETIHVGYHEKDVYDFNPYEVIVVTWERVDFTELKRREVKGTVQDFESIYNPNSHSTLVTIKTPEEIDEKYGHLEGLREALNLIRSLSEKDTL